MIKALEAVLLSSENATKLAKFYREKVGLKQTMEMEIGDKGEKAFDFELKGANLYILDHSKIKGKNKQPPRVRKVKCLRCQSPRINRHQGKLPPWLNRFLRSLMQRVKTNPNTFS